MLALIERRLIRRSTIGLAIYLSVEPKRMYKLTALFCAVVAIVYADPGSDRVFSGYLLPAVFLVAFVYLFTWWGSLILGTSAVCFYFMDVSSASVLQSVLLPLMFALSLVVFVIWAWKAGFLIEGGHTHLGSTAGGDAGGDGGAAEPYPVEALLLRPRIIHRAQPRGLPPWWI